MRMSIKLKYIFAVLIVSLFISANLYAQDQLILNKTRVTLNSGIQLPVSNFSDSVKTGYGILISLDYSPPSSPFSFSFTGSFNTWKFKDSTTYMGYSFYSIPLMFGIKYHFPLKFLETYIGGDIGVILSSRTIPHSIGENNFGYSGVAGIKYKIKDINLVSIDVNVRYWALATEQLSTYWLAFNAGVTFNL